MQSFEGIDPNTRSNTREMTADENLQFVVHSTDRSGLSMFEISHRLMNNILRFYLVFENFFGNGTCLHRMVNESCVNPSR